MIKLSTLVISASLIVGFATSAVAADQDTHTGNNTRYLDYPAGGVSFYQPGVGDHHSHDGLGAFGSNVTNSVDDRIRYYQGSGGLSPIFGGPPYGPAD